ncbi:nif-specific transcriptional activator NifA [Cohaesibacter sp. CAU 1516]|uniref:nif-specific transcriptional activator NifA n=1 Tax=Cohaesibacter sp. CAU 1516 TaxID=2576038 RepID=UPI0010FDE6B5|nr:nif-specific transcriptional activator NifA [Cohaesibacter sp. CAU 1516]TLP44266.1 nif-specific transcriptional activator NifA [Cohaesibacter sp. CAU 1516]
MRADPSSRPSPPNRTEGVCPHPVYCSFYRQELDTLYQVSQLLGQSLNLEETSQEVLKLLHEEGRLHYGMICLVDETSGDLKITDMHQDHSIYTKNVRYQPGEGIVGSILSEKKLILVRRIADEPRFLDRLGMYDPDLPFIGAPIFTGGDVAVGVLAVQPNNGDRFLEDNAKLVQMIASLIGRVLQLSSAVQAEQNELRAERDSLRRRVKRQHGFENVVGETEAMRMVFDQVRLVAKWNTTVLIRGESGTGKELIANAIHYNSPRAHEPILKLNCAALPDNLLESELFGHEKGAFTGATSMRKGRFEEADGGTLFLDEIGEITPAFQSKLLRVLQEGEFERVGGNKTIKVDVRIIAATNKDLEASIENGDFREDLYYRLNVMAINMPSLQDRMDDIPDLARFLIAKIGSQQGRPLTLKDSAIRLLMRHTWPGNVRELENCLERASVMSPTGIIDRETVSLTGLPEKALVGVPSQPLPPILKSASHAAEPSTTPAKAWHDEELDERERVIAALEEAGWVQAKAARLLDMTPRQIAYRIKILGISVRKI